MPAVRGNDYAVGNDGGAPEGNSNARGNSGGGAPENNFNAAKHHGWSDPLKHYHRLAGKVREKADVCIEERREMYAEYHMIDLEEVEAHIVEHQDFESEEEVRDAFRKVSAISDQSMRTHGPFFEKGFVVEERVEYGPSTSFPSETSSWWVLSKDVERDPSTGEIVAYTKSKVNPAIKADLRLSSKRRSLELDLGLIENERYLFVWTAQRPDIWWEIAESDAWNEAAENSDSSETDTVQDSADATSETDSAGDEIGPSPVTVDQSVESLGHGQESALAADGGQPTDAADQDLTWASRLSRDDDDDDDENHHGVRTF